MSQSTFMGSHHQGSEWPPAGGASKMQASLSVDNLLGEQDFLLGESDSVLQRSNATAQPAAQPTPPLGVKRPTIIRPSKSNDNLKSATLQGNRPPAFRAFEAFEMPASQANTLNRQSPTRRGSADPGALVNPVFRLESDKRAPAPPRPRKKMPPPRPPPPPMGSKMRDQSARSSRTVRDGDLITFDPLAPSSSSSSKVTTSTANSRSVMSELEEIFSHHGHLPSAVPLIPDRVGAASAPGPSELPPAKPARSVPARKPTSLVKPILTVPHAKALYDFEKEHPDDLAMSVGDVVRLIEKKDDEWFLGYNLRTRQEGIFPKSFVEIAISLPDEESHTEPVPTTRPRSSLIKSSSPDPQPPWLAPAKPPETSSTVSASSPSAPVPAKAPTPTRRGHFVWPPPGAAPVAPGPKPVPAPKPQLAANGARPPILTSKPKTVSLGSKPPKPRAPHCRALFPYATGVEGDLSFEAGDVIHLLGRESDAWLRGEVRGRDGIFPSNYVEIIEDLPTPPAATKTPSPEPTRTERPPPPTMKAPPPPPTVAPSVKKALFLVTALYDYSGPAGDLSFSAGDTIKVLKQVNDDWLMGELNRQEGTFPTNFVKRLDPPRSPPPPARKKPPVPMAKATYAFASSEKGDLTFQVGDQIILKEKVDADWLRGELNGCVGIFPKSFVEIIVPL